MANYNSGKHTAGFIRKTNGETIQFGTVTLSSAAANGDTASFFYLPNASTVIEAILSSTDIDTNGTPTATIDLGDAGDADRYIAASTIGRAGGVDRLGAHAGFLYEQTADTLLKATINNPATGATGTLKAAVIYTQSQ